MNKKTMAALISGLLFSAVAQADFKNLVCDKPISDNELIIKSRNWYQKWCDKGSKAECDQLKVEDARIEECKTSPFSERFIFGFDTASLEGKSSMDAEQEYVACYKMDKRVVNKVGIESTPSFIVMKMANTANFDLVQFIKSGLDKFVIDRETLVGTYGKESKYKCRIEEVSKRKNKI